jgi:glycosyltransferase involved in cell wall biosynthesis
MRQVLKATPIFGKIKKRKVRSEMKNLNIAYSFPSRMGVSGVGMTSWNQVNELVKKGVNVYLFTASLERDMQNLSFLKETLKPLGIRVPMKPFGHKLVARIHDIITANAILSERFSVDAIHCWPLGSESTLKAAKKLGIKTFLERPNAHTGYAFNVVKQEYELIGLTQTKKHTHKFDKKHLEIETREYALADKILCPSDFVAESFRLNGYREGKLAYHQYGYDPQGYYPLEENNKDDKRGITIVFLGRCEPRKGLHYALDAWLSSEASEVGTFYICGDFVEGYRELLSEKLAHKSIVIMNFTDDVTSLLQKCDALILPSVEEGSALVTYEARACGSTLLISNSSGAHAKHMFDSLIHETRDVDTLTKHLNLLHNDKELLNKLKQNSLRSANSLTWEKSAETLIEVYRSEINQL